MPSRILTLHPDGKKGVNIDRAKYNLVRNTLIDILSDHPEITYQEMNTLAKDHLKSKFDGCVPWYVITIKLDLEAKGIIERIPNSSPQKIRLKQ